MYFPPYPLFLFSVFLREQTWLPSWTCTFKWVQPYWSRATVGSSIWVISILLSPPLLSIISSSSCFCLWSSLHVSTCYLPVLILFIFAIQNINSRFYWFCWLTVALELAYLIEVPGEQKQNYLIHHRECCNSPTLMTPLDYLQACLKNLFCTCMWTNVLTTICLCTYGWLKISIGLKKQHTGRSPLSFSLFPILPRLLPILIFLFLYLPLFLYFHSLTFQHLLSLSLTRSPS